MKTIIPYIIVLGSLMSSGCSVIPFKNRIDSMGSICFVIDKKKVVVKTIRIQRSTWFINTPQDEIVYSSKLPSGIYSIDVELNSSQFVVKNCVVLDDSMTFLPLNTSFEDTIDWNQIIQLNVKNIPSRNIIKEAFVSGTVKDAFTDLPLIGATVFVNGFSWTATQTNENGTYCIKTNFIGQYNISAAKINYHKGLISDVRLGEDSISTVNIKLTSSTIPEEQLNLQWQSNIHNGSCVSK